MPFRSCDLTLTVDPEARGDWRRHEGDGLALEELFDLNRHRLWRVVCFRSPPEMHGWDAGQTIDQTRLFPPSVRDFVPEGHLAL